VGGIARETNTGEDRTIVAPTPLAPIIEKQRPITNFSGFVRNGRLAHRDL